MIYLVPVVYSMYGRVEIEADSPERALEIAENSINDLPLPNDADYLEDSFEIDSDGIIIDEKGNIAN